MLKKILSGILLLTLFFGLGHFHNTYAQSDERYFIVTAYYSPLPNQSKYIMGSYEAEIRMNGKGYRGASGKKVFSGMLAAPSTYSFGTKIHLDGLGVGEVSDRGGAIVKAGVRGFKYDRIDVWVGHGEEGLQRAMYWGKRTIKGTIVSKSRYNTLKIGKIPAPKWTTAYLPKNVTFKQRDAVFTYGIGTKSEKSSILALQKYLKNINFYQGEIDGKYSKQLMHTIYAFQKENNIVSSWSDIYAGYWSSKTRDLVWKKKIAGEFTENNLVLKKGHIEERKTALGNNQVEKKIVVQTQSEKLIDIFGEKITNSKGVERLQRILKKLGFYNGEVSGKYSDVRKSVLSFQIENKVINNQSSIGAGNYGPATRNALHIAYKQYGENKQKEREKQAKQQTQYNKQKTIAKKQVDKLGNIKIGDISPQVREFQKILQKVGYFKHKDTAIFGPKTKQAVINYQIEKKLIKSSTSQGAGIVGPQTKNQLIEDLAML